MTWSHVKVRMNELLDTVGRLLLDWLGEYLPRISEDWWEECVLDNLDDIHRDAKSLGELDLLTLLYLTKKNAVGLSECSSTARGRIISVSSSVRKVRNGWHHLSTAAPRSKDLVLSDLKAVCDFFVMVGATAELNDAEAFSLELEKSEIEEDLRGAGLRGSYLSEIEEAKAMMLSDAAEKLSEPEPDPTKQPRKASDETESVFSPKTPEDPFSRGLDFHQTAKGCTVRGKGSCRDVVLVIPSVYKGKPVTRIGEGAFANAVWIKKVIIPDSVHHIGEGAFKGCTGLKSVEIPHGVTGIAKDAFYRCVKLASVAIPDTVTSLGGGAFLACSSLSEVYYDAEKLKDETKGTTFSLAGTETYGLSVTIGRHVREIPGGLFYTAKPDPGETEDKKFGPNLRKVVFEEGSSCERICDLAFYGCEGLEEISLPQSLRVVGALVFYDCVSLRKVSLPDEVSFIDEWAFRNTALETFVFPSYLTYISEGTFSACAKLKSVKFPEELCEIGRKAFMDCVSLEECDLPAGVNGIGALAFYGCSSLRFVNLPDSLFEIGFEAFLGCSGIRHVFIPEDVVSVGYGAFKDCTGLIEVIIGAYNVDIGYSAFCGCSSLEILEMYSDRVSIGSNAFGECTKLRDVELHCDVQDIEPLLFSRCVSLEEIIIPDNTEYIDHHAFQECASLRTIVLPAEIYDVGICAFLGCESLERVLYKGTPDDWKKVMIDAGNGCLASADVYFYGEKNLSDGHGHWYFDDWDEIVVSEPKKPRRKGSGGGKPGSRK